jgi:homogentisate 1,2-dioxygenase
MLDTIRPLSATADAIEVEDPGYQDSFIASPGSGPGSA